MIAVRYWLFAPRSATHNIGGWYIETWNNQVLHKKRHSVRTGDEYGVVELSGQENLRYSSLWLQFLSSYSIHMFLMSLTVSVSDVSGVSLRTSGFDC